MEGIDLTTLSDEFLMRLATEVDAERTRRREAAACAWRERRAEIDRKLGPMVAAINDWLDQHSKRWPVPARAIGTAEHWPDVFVTIYCGNGNIRDGEQMVRKVLRLLATRSDVAYTVGGPQGSPGTYLHVTQFGPWQVAALMAGDQNAVDTR